MNEISEHIADEWYVVRHSGELPEIALHSSIYYLTEAADGPGVSISEGHLLELQLAAVERYKEIILRDLLPENRQTTMYRGIKRAIVNYQRYTLFCTRQGVEPAYGFPEKVATALMNLVVTEVEEVGSEVKRSVLNCSYMELSNFARELNISLTSLPEGLSSLCHDAP